MNKSLALLLVIAAAIAVTAWYSYIRTAGVDALHDDIAGTVNQPFAGDPKGDVTMVIFCDYNSPDCRQLRPILAELLDRDGHVRIIYKEFPILGSDSEMAAKAALAVNSIDPSKYLAFQQLIMDTDGSAVPQLLLDTAIRLNIPEEAYMSAISSSDRDAEIQHNRKLADALHISGTPGVVVGDEVMSGRLALEDLMGMVAIARKQQLPFIAMNNTHERENVDVPLDGSATCADVVAFYARKNHADPVAYAQDHHEMATQLAAQGNCIP